MFYNLSPHYWFGAVDAGYLLKHIAVREGCRKKNRISYGLLPNPPSDPRPPRYGLFTDKKIYTHFFLEIESMIAKTNFTLGPIEKFIFFVKL